MKNIILIILLVVLSSCNAKPKVGSPWMQELLHQGPQNAPNDFRIGWIDGCETGISASSNALQRHFYKFKQDYKMAQNQEYYTGWKIAFSYCQRYVFQYLRRNLI